MKRGIFILMFLMLLVPNLGAQNYIHLGDAAGYNYIDTSKVGEVEGAIQELIQIFPEDFRDDFKVYDFGFYLHHESYIGGHPEAFQTKINQIQSPNYLAFGKQTDANGIYTKFWVELKLPNTDQFACLDLVGNDFRANLKERLNDHANLTHRLNNNTSNLFYEAEIATIKELKKRLSDLWACCDGTLNLLEGESCSFSGVEGYDVFNKMIAEGFAFEIIEITDDPDYILDAASGSTASTLKKGSIYAKDAITNADIKFKVHGDSEEWQLDTLINKLVVNNHINYLNERLDLSLTSATDVGKHFYKYPRDNYLDFDTQYQEYLNDNKALKVIVGVINLDGRIGILGYKTDVKTTFKDHPKLKNEVAISIVHTELDEIGSENLSRHSIDYIRKYYQPDFNLLPETVEDGTLTAGYLDALLTYEQGANNITVSEKIRQLWSEEYHFYEEYATRSFSRGEMIATRMKVNWNLSSYAVHASSFFANYRRTRNEAVLELLLGVECSKSSGEDSFKYLLAGSLKGNNSRRIRLDYLLDNVNVYEVLFLAPEGIYDVYNQPITMLPESVVVPLEVGNFYFPGGSVTLQGNNGFSCSIITLDTTGSTNLHSLFENGLNIDLTSTYEEDALLLKESANNCANGEAKRILSTTPSCAIEKLDNKTRIKLINCLASEWIFQGGVGETEEAFIIKLLNSIKTEEYCDFIYEAEKSQGGLDIKKLLRAIDFPAPSKALLGAFVNVFNNCAERFNREVVGVYTLDKTIINSFERRSFDFKIRDKRKIEIYQIAEIDYGDVSVTLTGPKDTFGIFTPLDVISKLKVDNIGLQGNIELGKVPAVAVAIILQNYNNQEFYDRLNQTVNLAFLFLGIAEVRAALLLFDARNFVTVRNLAVAVMDVGVWFADEYCKNDSESELCKKWKKVSFYVSIGLLSSAALDAGKITKVNEEIYSFARQLSNVEKFEDYPKVTEFLTKAKEMPEDVLNRFENIDLANQTDESLIQILNADLEDSDFLLYLIEDSKGFKTWETLKSLPRETRTDVAILGRLEEDFVTHPEFKTFLDADPSRPEKWAILNKIRQSEHGLTDLKLSEWYEDLWMLDELEIVSLEANRVKIKYAGDDIAEIDNGGVRYVEFDDVENYTASNVKKVSDDREFAIFEKNGKAGCKGVACFVAGTPISIGHSTVKSIENVKRGDMVSAYDFTTKKAVLSKVLSTKARKVNELVTIVARGDTLFTTKEHPFYTVEDGWKAAENLYKGIQLYTFDNSVVKIDTIFGVDSIATVYNFEVKEQHNYFVGKSRVLVHNSYDFDGKVGLGNSELSTMTMQARSSSINPNTTRNFATIKYINNNGSIQYKSFRSLASGTDGHTEQLVFDFLDENGISYENLLELHSELIPCVDCTGRILEELQHTQTNTRITWDFNDSDRVERLDYINSL